jgi:hypothetical protein
MARVYVVRSRVSQTLDLAGVAVRPWHFAEVPVERMVDGVLQAVAEAKSRREVDVHLVIDGKPIAAGNESVALSRSIQSGPPVETPILDQASHDAGVVKVEGSDK